MKPGKPVTRIDMALDDDRRIWFRAMSTDAPATTKWVCESCGYIYDPEEGDPDGGIPAGTAFEEVPDDWFCPVCGARKKDFEPMED